MDPDRPSFLLVDGNNLLFAWDDLRAMLPHRRALAKSSLIQCLTDWCDDSDERVVLVFDGSQASPREEKRDHRIQVIYGGPGETADDIIERLTLKYVAQYTLTIATDDHAICDLVEAAGAEVLSARGLRERIEAGRRSREEWLKRHRRRE